MTLDAAGLVALADLTTIAKRTALTGTSSFLDIFVLCPGLHRQQAAPELNLGEYPACAAMTTGYVFRVENQATVVWLQSIGETGQLTTVSVTKRSGPSSRWLSPLWPMLYDLQVGSVVGAVAYGLAVALTMAILGILAWTRDWWGLAVVGILIFARFCNVLVIRERARRRAWQGAPEPGVKGDLLVLLSQDRWVRLQGPVDDLKAVTSGQWLEEQTFVQGSLTAFATVLVYLDAALASNTAQTGQILLLILLFCSAGLLAIANEKTEVLSMHGCVLQVDGKRRKYKRRLSMAEELAEETGRRDWAIRMGMLMPLSESDSKSKGPVIA